MFLNWNGKLIEQEPEFYDDIFNIHKTERKLDPYAQLDDVFYIKQNGGDGEYSYKIIWVIKNGNIIQRIINEI